MSTERRGGAIVVTLKGHIATAESQVLSQSLEAVVCDGFDLLVIDLSDVEIITSDGLGALIRAKKSVTEAGGTFAIAGVRGNIRELFRMTRLDKLFAMYDSADEALKALAKSPQ